MSIQKLNADGLGLRFKIKGDHVVFLTENGEEKATRPATPAELVLWGELSKALLEKEELKTALHEAEESNLPTQRELRSRQHEILEFELWIQKEYPGELNEVEGLFGTLRRMLRKAKEQGTPEQARQRGGMAVREAQRPPLTPEDAPLSKPVRRRMPRL